LPEGPPTHPRPLLIEKQPSPEGSLAHPHPLLHQVMTHRLAVQRPTSDPLIHVDGGRFLGRVGCRIGQLISGHAPEVRRPGSRWGGAVERLSAFQARHIPSWHESCERYRPSLIAAACCWLLLLLSPLLSAAIRKAPAAPDPARRSVPRRAPFLPARPLLGWNSPTPPPNPTAAEPRDGRVLSRPSSRVHEPCILAGSGCPDPMRTGPQAGPLSCSAR